MNTQKYIVQLLFDLANIPKIISNIEKDMDMIPYHKNMMLRFYRDKKKDMVREIETLRALDNTL